MTIAHAGSTVRRWWWILLALPLLGLVSGFVATRDQPYESSFRATVLIPGDTEIPGRSERPELMVMDDAPALVDSRAFAELVHTALPAQDGTSLTIDDVQNALSASRYSRILTVTSARDDAAEAEAIALAAAGILSDAINQYLVANPDVEPATVQVIDPPGAATKSAMDRVTRIAAQAGAAMFMAIVLALMLDAVFPPGRNNAPAAS
jgi:hypothetical protein